MELKEARKLSKSFPDMSDRHGVYLTCQAAIILDNRITELEAEMKQVLEEFDEVETQRDELLKAGTARINALNDLLACYRLGRQQSDKLFNRLLESGIVWEKVKQSGVAD